MRLRRRSIKEITFQAGVGIATVTACRMAGNTRVNTLYERKAHKRLNRTHITSAWDRRDANPACDQHAMRGVFT